MKKYRKPSIENRGTKPGELAIQLMALDLTHCTRCTGTLDNIEQAIGIVQPVLKALNLRASVEKIVVHSEAEAERLHYITSPTVRINGRDIVAETLESECDSCNDLCGCEQGTSCRVWLYQGKEFTEAPLALVIEAILIEIFGGRNKAPEAALSYGGVPENLQRFFKGKASAQVVEETCCSETEKESCCEPGEKATCCDASQPESCGCR